MDMPVQYEVRNAGTATYITRGTGFFSRMAVTCRECGARHGLISSARGEATSITCPRGHITRDRRLAPEAIRDAARAAAVAGVSEVPVDAEVWLKVPAEPASQSRCDDIR
jgi:hypothetical protein